MKPLVTKEQYLDFFFRVNEHETVYQWHIDQTITQISHYFFKDGVSTTVINLPHIGSCHRSSFSVRGTWTEGYQFVGKKARLLDSTLNHKSRGVIRQDLDGELYFSHRIYKRGKSKQRPKPLDILLYLN